MCHQVKLPFVPTKPRAGKVEWALNEKNMTINAVFELSAIPITES